MFCTIYKSLRHEQLYLYVEEKDNFSLVPDELMQYFGHPQLLMSLNLTTCKTLANADINHVKKEIKTKGYYLQIPSKDPF